VTLAISEFGDCTSIPELLKRMPGQARRQQLLKEDRFAERHSRVRALSQWPEMVTCISRYVRAMPFTESTRKPKLYIGWPEPVSKATAVMVVQP
jgi:hypothetical protein